MSKNMSLFRSMVTLRCPSCHQESMFVNEKIYTWSQMSNVKQQCGHCHTNLSPETGFYFGAAYVSWALTVALWVSVLVALNCFNAWGLIEYSFLTHPVTFLTTGMACTLILFPYLLRLSRSIWAHFFIKDTSNKDESINRSQSV